MTEYYNPTRSHFASRFTFNQTKQRTNECTSAFVTRLKRQAAFCDFKNEADDRVLEQLVAGCKNPDFKQYCLTIKGIDLDKAIKKAKEQEASEADLLHMEKETPGTRDSTDLKSASKPSSKSAS